MLLVGSSYSSFLKMVAEILSPTSVNFDQTAMSNVSNDGALQI
jgi:hypothetical protein